MTLTLKGSPWRDVAGRLLHFSNPAPKGDPDPALVTEQMGVVDGITASGRVKVVQGPMEEVFARIKCKESSLWKWGNCSYLEWHGERNGRLMIESPFYELKIVGDATWDRSEEEDTVQRQTNGEAMINFMERLTKGLALQDEWEKEDSTEEEGRFPDGEDEEK